MSQNARVSLLIIGNLFLYLCVGEINTALSQLSLYLHADVLFLVFFGLFLNRLSNVIYIGLLGFLAEAIRPVPTGLYVVGYLAMWLALVWAQGRIRRQSALHLRWTAVAVQALWLLLLGGFLGLGRLGEWAYWQRFFIEAGFSLFIVGLVAPFWCRLQKDMLFALGWDLDAQVHRR